MTLFASGDSRTSAKLVRCCRRALRLDPEVRDPAPYPTLMLEGVRKVAGDCDILHFHIDYLHFPLLRPMRDRVLTTLHGRLDIPDPAIDAVSRVRTELDRAAVRRRFEERFSAERMARDCIAIYERMLESAPPE